eukprot:5018879-Pleurochrysis_carterae.AAC.1
MQIKELLRQAHEHARQQQEMAVRKATDEVRAACEEEKAAAMDAAKAAVQMSALQQAEELDRVMVEVRRRLALAHCRRHAFRAAAPTA